MQIIINFNEQEQELLTKTLTNINQPDFKTWLTNAVTQAITQPEKPIDNPFVINWKTTRTTIKYFENRLLKSIVPTKMDLTLPFADDEVTEVLADHGNGFWDINRIANYIISQLLTNSENQFMIPYTPYEKFLLTTFNTTIIQEDSQD